MVFGQPITCTPAPIAADDYEGLDVEGLKDFKTLVKLLLLLEFGTAGADDVETAGVAVFVDNLLGKLLILMLYETARTEQEAEKLVLRVELLETVKETGDDVVAATLLSAISADGTNSTSGMP